MKKGPPKGPPFIRNHFYIIKNKNRIQNIKNGGPHWGAFLSGK